MGLPALANGALDNEADRVGQTLLDRLALPGRAVLDAVVAEIPRYATAPAALLDAVWQHCEQKGESCSRRWRGPCALRDKSMPNAPKIELLAMVIGTLVAGRSWNVRSERLARLMELTRLSLAPGCPTSPKGRASPSGQPVGSVDTDVPFSRRTAGCA
jgi:hypothetical protein